VPTPDLGSSPRPSAVRTDNNLVKEYKKLFKVIEANTPELLREAYRIRYQVYCVEHEFLDQAANPGELETDEYDRHSVHALLAHRPTGNLVGTIRLVLHRPGATVGSLPIHTVCDHPLLRSSRLPLETTGELSRFAICKQFRRRINDGMFGAPTLDDSDSRRIIPHMTLGLLSIAVEFMIRHGVDHVCAVMEPTLLRLLSRFGIHFTLLGPPLEYHGIRQPCFAPLGELLQGIASERLDVWNVITDEGRLRPPPIRPERAELAFS
jgi:N-acyl amino acid synthase of PEP-CTERM/exosortase system